MIAPEPFFEPRGTPFSEYHRIRALLELGHTVDLVTYPFGSDVSLPGLRVFRFLRPAFVRDVRIGPSLAKVPLDVMLAITALRRAASERYDAVHSHEEGSYIGVPIARLLGLPHLYDMHSSLPQQLTNFAFSPDHVRDMAGHNPGTFGRGAGVVVLDRLGSFLKRPTGTLRRVKPRRYFSFPDGSLVKRLRNRQ